ncbi:hypothetical protein [Embleya hyalina]|uniref:Uncharacterized protein n=1 Tax=Embleya hyalina TaxID=516124 RepID=A0A401YYP2_9ACTN|nr:hypothetical protein [Embleya hyalina]GCD99754.1 hypothetical protein EHYA_07476 [Embleya hyalina]
MQIVTVAGHQWITLRELEHLTAAAVDVAAHTPGCAILRALPGRSRLTRAASTEVITTLAAVRVHPTVRSGLTRLAHTAANNLAAISCSGAWVSAHDIGAGPETRTHRPSRSREHAPAR